MYFDERDNEIELSNYENEFKKYENIYNDIDNKKWDNDFNIDIKNLNINNFNRDNNILYTSKEGLNKGNMFKNSYDPYKNYIYKVIVKGEKDELLLKIQELTFKMIDLNLYLDIFPNDINMYKEFKETSELLKKHKELYEKNYGPLCLDNTLYYDNYMWNKNPWPWMNERGNK